VSARIAAALTRRWWTDTPSPWLTPLARIFGIAVALRRKGYRHGLLRTATVGVPVIVAGNLAVGGSGKTPFVIWCARLLAVHGWRPAVLTRGYGVRAHPEPRRVEAGSDPARAGDEPVLIARATGVPVWVHARRARAARAAVAAGADVLVCDDGLQHYALARDIECVLVDGRRRFGNRALLPAGPLREPASRLREADFVVCKEGPCAPGEVAMRYVHFRVEPLAGGAARPLESFAPGPVHAVAGIADPSAFFATLRTHGVAVIEHPFPDHHPFAAADLAFADGLPVLMTAKDAIKCSAFAAARLWSVGHEVALPDAFATRLLARLEVLRRAG
jgi:tetraacyldisaccharide 4'-kinase